MKSRAIIVGIFLGALAGGALYILLPHDAEKPNPLTILKTKIPAGTTFSDLARWLGVDSGTAMSLIETSRSKYNLAKIVSGRELALTFDAFGGGLKQLVYNIDSEERLIVESEDTDGSPSWEAKVENIPYEIKQKEAFGTISSSLYGALKESGYDERLALALAEMFAWQVDFVADTRVGDEFKAIYEERYLDGQYMMPGKIFAARYTNDGETFYGYWFSPPSFAEASEGKGKTRAGYYDQKGNSLQKQFLKAPLQYKYISSGYTYGRVNPVTRKVAPHRGIDYAAPAGTPAVSVGDGTVVQAGWNGPYGISALIRHNDTYQSRYGHFSRLAKGIKVGAKVKQGQIVGYVGSTGESTGPHLHYEMHKFGSHVNPFKIEVPPGDPVNEEDMVQFQTIVDKYKSIL